MNYSDPNDPAQRCDTCNAETERNKRNTFTVTMAHQDADERAERIRRMHANSKGPLCSRCALEPVRVAAS